MVTQSSYTRYMLHAFAGLFVWIALHIVIATLAPMLCAISQYLLFVPIGMAALLTLSFVIYSYVLGRSDSLNKVYPIGEIERFAGMVGSGMNLIALALVLTTAYSIFMSNPCTVLLMEQL